VARGLAVTWKIMLVMALDTATPAVTVGLVAWDDGAATSLAERVTVNPRAHGELLTPHLLEVLAEADHRIGDIEAIVVGCGPGPFTGLRVGMATAAAFGHACGRGVYPVCSLDAVAAQAEPDASVLVALDARRKEVYWAAYGPADGVGRSRLTGPHVDRPQDVPPQTAGLGIRFAAGEMADRHRDVLGVDVIAPKYPTPLGLVAAAGPALSTHAEPPPLVPLYLRRPDAELPGRRKAVLADARGVA
jgi:tRNA threonylcarbamoyl adenosine modification protein YeaZ